MGRRKGRFDQAWLGWHALGVYVGGFSVPAGLSRFQRSPRSVLRKWSLDGKH